MTQVAVQEFSLEKKPLKNITSTSLSRLNITLKLSLTSCQSDQTSLGMWVLLSLSQLALHHKMSPWLSTPEVNSPGFTATKHYPTQLHSTRPDPHLTKPSLVLHPPAPTGPRTSLYLLYVTPTTSAMPTLSYADASSSDGNLASDVFHIGSSDLSGLDFGCMDSVFSSNSDEDSKNTGLVGMNRGSLSFVSQLGFPKFFYCVSGTDFSGLLLLGESNLTWSVPLNYTPLIQISTHCLTLIGLPTRYSLKA